jgi:dehydrogenase/reductase SDR family member 12
MVNKREVTDEGLEKNFATNTLGTHVLTTELVPLLSKVRNIGIVSNTSKLVVNANSKITIRKDLFPE